MESGDAIRQLHCSALLLDRHGIRQASCVFACRDSKDSKRGTDLERVSMRVVKPLQAVNNAVTTLNIRQADSATGLLTSTFSLVALKLELNIGAVGIANRRKLRSRKETIHNLRHSIATSPVWHRAYMLMCNAMHAGGLPLCDSQWLA